MILVTGSATAREGAEEEVQKISVVHVLRSHNEQGCISHEVSRDVQEPRGNCISVSRHRGSLKRRWPSSLMESWR